jgi:hypothetical protein
MLNIHNIGHIFNLSSDFFEFFAQKRFISPQKPFSLQSIRTLDL